MNLVCASLELAEAARPKTVQIGVEWPCDATEAMTRSSSGFIAPNA